MATCEVCGNGYDKGMEITVSGASHVFRGPRSGGLGLLRDLHDLYRMAIECDIAWTLVGQATQGARDETAIELKWLRTRLKEAAPQALVVAR
jgi:hypothetical protein